VDALIRRSLLIAGTHDEEDQNHRTDLAGRLERGLVDEVLLLVCPVLLGPGKRFFSDKTHPCELALVSTKAASSGVLMNTYRYVGSLPTERA
jgi:RibD C-terminal domain